MDDTSRSLQARVAAILIPALHIKLENSGNIAILQSIFQRIMFQCHLVYTGRMSSTFTIRDIVNEDATASVSDYGAHVLSWAPAGEQAVVWRPKAIYLKEGTAIRGGVPIIFPWFNSGFEGGHVASKTPKHGFARNSFWHYDEEGSSDTLLRYTLDSSEIDADILSQFVSGLNPQFHAVYTIEVGRELTMSLTVYNDGDEPLSYEEALHTYLQVGDAERSQVCGLEGADYLDTVLDGDPRCSQGDEPVTFQGIVDRIYYSTDTLELRDPVLQRTIIVSKQGAAQTVVWNPGEQAGNAIGDLSDGEWRGFVCVEAVNNRDCAVVVPPHDSHTLQQTLAVKH